MTCFNVDKLTQAFLTDPFDLLENCGRYYTPATSESTPPSTRTQWSQALLELGNNLDKWSKCQTEVLRGSIFDIIIQTENHLVSDHERKYDKDKGGIFLDFLLHREKKGWKVDKNMWTGPNPGDVICILTVNEPSGFAMLMALQISSDCPQARNGQMSFLATSAEFSHPPVASGPLGFSSVVSNNKVMTEDLSESIDKLPCEADDAFLAAASCVTFYNAIANRY